MDMTLNQLLLGVLLLGLLTMGSMAACFKMMAPHSECSDAVPNRQGYCPHKQHRLRERPVGFMCKCKKNETEP